jgi:hypothetical protein
MKNSAKEAYPFVIARRVLFPTKQSHAHREIASGWESTGLRNDSFFYN